MKRAFRSAPDGHRSDVDTRHPRYEETCPVLDANRRPCPYQRSIDVTRFGDTTPGSFETQGKKSYRTWRPWPRGAGLKKVTGLQWPCLRWRDGRVPDLSQLSQIWWYRFGTVFSSRALFPGDLSQSCLLDLGQCFRR